MINFLEYFTKRLRNADNSGSKNSAQSSAIFEPSQISPISKEDEELYQNLIRNIEAENLNPDSWGVFKESYLFPQYGICILKSRGISTKLVKMPYNEDRDFNPPPQSFWKKSATIEAIRSHGIPTPKALYGCEYLSNPQRIKQSKEIAKNSTSFCVMELIQGEHPEIYSNSIAKEKLTHFYPTRESAIKALSNNLEFQQRFLNFGRSNLELRVLTQQKHLETYLKNFEKLDQLNALEDCHGENVIYHPNNGFTFIDLSLKNFNNMSKTEMFLRNTSPDTNFAFMKRNHSVVPHFLRGLGSVFNYNLHCQNILTNKDKFALHLYNGICCEQILRATKKHLDNKTGFDEASKNKILKEVEMFQPNLKFSFEEVELIHEAIITNSHDKYISAFRGFNFNPSQNSNIQSEILESINLPVFLQAMENMKTGTDCQLDENQKPIISKDIISQANTIKSEVENQAEL